MPTEQEWRDRAAAARKAAAMSLERSDTDGALTQWALDLTARRCDAEATIAADGGRAEFPALFDLDGKLVEAKLVRTRYGQAWMVKDEMDPRGVRWFNPSRAHKGVSRLTHDEEHGYRVGSVKAPAYADIEGTGTGLAGAATCHVVLRRQAWAEPEEIEVVSDGTGPGDYPDL